MTPLMMICMAAFIGVAALVGGVALLLRPEQSSRVEDRLDLLTGLASPKESPLKQASVLAQPLDAQPGLLETLLSRFGNIERLMQQADVSVSLSQLGITSAVLAAVGAAAMAVVGVPPAIALLAAFPLAALPLLWLLWRRSRRLKKFGAQLPDALDMLGRALRAGQALGSAFSIVAGEMPAPLGREFGRVFEEQNLGISLEDSLNSLAERVPNMDLKFFVTAVLLQRQTGGDLAEILDKIAHLIRERFQIWGQIQALTGEGRLSGVVLLALPVVLFLAVYKLNPNYVMVLFTDPMGKKMLAVAVFLQLVGAWVIRKIVNIKV